MLLVEDEFAGPTGFDMRLPLFHQNWFLLLIDKEGLDEPTLSSFCTGQ